jgi:hypothetical protein
LFAYLLIIITLKYTTNKSGQLIKPRTGIKLGH